MSADDFSGLARGVHLSQHLPVTGRHAGKIHHFTQADDARPGECLGHILQAEFRTGCLKTGGRWNAGRHLHPNMHRLPGGFVCHQFDTLQSEDVGNLVRVNEHAGRAVRQHRPHEFGDRQHGRFHVHMPIQKTRHQEPAACFDHACIFCQWYVQRPGPT